MSTSPEVQRLRRLLASGKLLHPCLDGTYFEQHDSNIDDHRIANFTDLADALAACCGAQVGRAAANPMRDKLVNEIGSDRKHIILVLCDGMGTEILNEHLEPGTFLRRNNQQHRLRAVFPSTTPAALTTLATAQWPGQHGMPGWDLREQVGCDYPGDIKDTSIVQLRILAPEFQNLRTGEPANYSSWDKIFLAEPWARQLRQRSLADKTMKPISRGVLYINAYNGVDLPTWFPGVPASRAEESVAKTDAPSKSSDFSLWQSGQTSREDGNASALLKTNQSYVGSASIGEVAFESIGSPEGSHAAVSFFRDGVDTVLQAVAAAEAQGMSTFIYLYTAHPDEHMHALGTKHAEVRTVVEGLNSELDRLWDALGDRDTLLQTYGMTDTADASAIGQQQAVSASLIVTADHGHITVEPSDMVVLPVDIIEMLEYANIGVLGKGRHAYLHCKSGLQMTVRRLWRDYRELDSFILLTIEEAIGEKLFGPTISVSPQVRPRMGDFVAVATTNSTLVTPREFAKHVRHCQGAHGSLLPTEMKIPFVHCSRS